MYDFVVDESYKKVVVLCGMIVGGSSAGIDVAA